MNLLAEMTWPEWSVSMLIILVCLVLMLVILIQRGRGGGLSGAFGGGGGSAAFGAKTGDVFTWITVVVASVFLIMAVVGGFALDKSLPSASATPATVDETTPTEEGPEQPATQTTGTTAPAAPTSGQPVKVTPVPVEGAAAPVKTDQPVSGAEGTPAPGGDETAKPQEQPAGDEGAASPDAGSADAGGADKTKDDAGTDAGEGQSTP